MRHLIASPVVAVTPLAYGGEPSELALRYGEPAWPPMLVGALIGALVLMSMLVVRKPIGASSAYAAIAGLLGRTVAPSKTKSLSYYQDNPPKFGYSIVFLASIAVGSLLAAWHGGALAWQPLPAFWIDMFGEDSHGQRILWALSGGVLLAFGARTAGGCTSGHGISGALQLSAASWIALGCFFVGGVATAHLLYP
ncbi:YeeE/YedE thiosulfate transporter family protein [Pelagicoccus sp. SDUM812002]|uniref:YeeE/YedE thiosulfate transporter family protein n=1 Tax=Pelagicoccus sp. SDUM812002 TaxID=3041266 RepID=UPI00280FA0AE|nr:YeeE/YedE thiosulfate transporter family protein [Pelagicoccus sp. SDUM812002]MDQ8186799.1 YeeE/YedE thiosulfate transporter family protein [Pelagicoccus sp. SDUM812002]